MNILDVQTIRSRVRADNDRNSYVVVVRRSANHEFVWFHDLDGNRFELSRPL